MKTKSLPMVIRCWALGLVVCPASLAPARGAAASDLPGPVNSIRTESKADDAWQALDQLMNLRITVTRHENAIDAVSARVEVITGIQAEQQDATSLLELGRQTTSMECSRLVNIPYVFTRGIGSDLTSIGVDSSTALHLDGVYLGLPDMVIPQLWDLDRVEILAGPQGSLYGRNADAGVINIINRQPRLREDRTEIRAKVGSNGLVGGEVRINQSTGSTGALRVSLMHRTDQGYTNNLDPLGSPRMDNHTANGARLQWLKGDPAHAFFLIGADYYRDRSGGESARPMDDFGAAFASAQPTAPGATRNNLPTYSIVTSRGLRIEAMRPWNDWQVRAILAWRALDNRYLSNTDGTEIDITASDSDRRINQVSADLLATTGLPEQQGRWTLGANLYTAHSEYDVGLIRPPLGASIVFISPLKNNAASVFAEWERRWAERWTITLGARYSFESKHSKMQRYTVPGLAGLASDLTNRSPALTADYRRKWANLNPRAVLDYRWGDGHHGYASITNGFKSGGMNSLSTDLPVQPESAWGLEVGHRYRTSDSRLAVSATAFQTEYRDLQVTSFLNSGARVRNAATARIRGMELSVQKQFTARLDLLAEATLLSARYESYTAVQGSQPFIADDKQMPHAPRWATNLTTRYHIPFAQGKLGFQATWSARAKTFFNALEDSVVAEKEISLWSAALTWQGRNNWHFSLSGQNLTNVRHNDNVARFTSTTSADRPEGNALGYPAPGRTCLLTVGRDF